MGRVPITVMGYRCERCDHEWIPRDAEQEPRVCPKCKSPYWNRPRKSAAPMAYDEFKSAIKTILGASGPLTWTEIRTKASLPQRFPNNVWVRRLETDIALNRAKDHRGIILWRLG